MQDRNLRLSGDPKIACTDRTFGFQHDPRALIESWPEHGMSQVAGRARPGGTDAGLEASAGPRPMIDRDRSWIWLLDGLRF
jgi:hypothetical protein